VRNAGAPVLTFALRYVEKRCVDLFDRARRPGTKVYEWAETVAAIPRDSWRVAYYIKNWNMVDKIRRAKAIGE
jgi:hypothetical protein